MYLNFSSLQEKLAQVGEEHLLRHWDTLSAHAQNTLARQIESLDLSTIREQKRLIGSPFPCTQGLLEPFTEGEKRGNVKNQAYGKALLAQGKVGCLVIAGGQGTRLNSAGPKGIYPISPIKNKSLFQLLAEKALAIGKQIGNIPPLAIMTSPLNHEETLTFFRQHAYFGLAPEQLFFYSQGMLPFLNEHKTLFLERPHQIAMGPNGNGTSLTRFFQSGIWQQWNEQGVEYLNYILIDNPLADPFDAELIGYHAQTQADVTIKCIARQQVEEKVGIIVKEQGKPKVIEYSEFPPEERKALMRGTYKHPYANISLFCFSMDFVLRNSQVSLPLHPHLKTAISLSPKEVFPLARQAVQAWKFETFIFDLLPYAHHLKILVYPRQECFSPLKNAHGEASPQVVKAALQAQDRRRWENIAHLSPLDTPFELSQEFHYPTKQLLAKWKGKQLPGNSYIEP